MDGSIRSDTNRAAPADPAVTGSYLNRDLSWLEFNRRVLHEALDDRTPLLERVRFLGIFTSNLDEFFMKRARSLRRQATKGAVDPTADGRTIAEVFAAVRAAVRGMLGEQAECYANVVRPLLAENSVHLLTWQQLDPSERQTADRYFQASVFPVLTPLAVDSGSPFPFISNLSMSLGVILHHPDRGENLFARIKVPEVLPKWIQVGSTPGQFRFVSLHELIRQNLPDLFPDMAIVDVIPFRLTRDADLERDEDDTDDLRELMQEELRQRRFARVVRLEHGPDPNPWIVRFLMSELELTEDDVYELTAELDYDDLKVIADLSIPRLRYEPWTPVVPTRLVDEDADLFAVIRNGDLLLHHPYDSFNASVERFINDAAGHPQG